MINRKKFFAVGEIFLMVSMSFAIAFIFSEYVGVGRGYNGGPVYEIVTQRTHPQLVTLANKPTTVPTPSEWHPPASEGISFLTGSEAGAGGAGGGAGAFSTFAEANLGNSVTIDGVTGVLGKEGGQYVLKDAAGTTTILDTSKVTSFSTGTETVTSGGAEAAGLKGIFAGTTFGTTTTAGLIGGALLSGAIWGGIVYGGLLLIGDLLGLDEGVTDALALGGGVGTFTGTSLYLIGANAPTTILTAEQALWLTTWGPWIGIGVGVTLFILTYEEEKKEIVRFECLPWEPPYGGRNCEKCNENPLMPCSEYRCKSLGQACELVNKGTGEEKCVWLHKDDTTAPHMEPSEDALAPEMLRYIPDSAISPPNRGFRIIDVENPNGCLIPFSRFTFGVETDELSKCRIDFKRTDKFEDMQFPLGNSQLFREKHIQELPVPNPHDQSGEAVSEIHSDGRYTLYIRCVDANGNGQDSAEVAFSFCVDKGPDNTPPRVMGTSIKDGSPVRFGADEVPIEVYTNEPAVCKWSKQDKDYGAMENEMSCVTESYQINADLNYVCTDILTGIKGREDNRFYFRCKDNPGKPENDRNVMRTSYPLLLRGTEELVIDSVGPTGTIQGSTSFVEVNLTAQTSHGAEEGTAVCGYSLERDDLASYITMFNTNSFSHSQPISLPAGDYTYFFKCTDAGGNTMIANTTFSIEVDVAAPEIARVFRDGNNLKIITDEEANCAYSTANCDYNFDEGEPMVWEGGNKMIHFVNWDPDVTYYMKCRDLQGNLPSPDACQMIVQGSEF